MLLATHELHLNWTGLEIVFAPLLTQDMIVSNASLASLQSKNHCGILKTASLTLNVRLVLMLLVAALAVATVPPGALGLTSKMKLNASVTKIMMDASVTTAQTEDLLTPTAILDLRSLLLFTTQNKSTASLTELTMTCTVTPPRQRDTSLQELLSLTSSMKNVVGLICPTTLTE
jgi:hypothetical protein